MAVEGGMTGRGRSWLMVDQKGEVDITGDITA